jgi:acyl-coenzyme A synthetase/AMP-(fatty) acid ligase
MLIAGHKYISLTHENLLARFQWQWLNFPYCEYSEGAESATVLAKTAPYFVDSLTEVWAAVLGGALLVLPEPHEVTVATRLLELIVLHRVHRLVATPTLLAMLLDADPLLLAAASVHVRQLTVSGEVLLESLALSCRAVFSSATLVHMYGATETTADVAACIVGELAQPRRIGMALAQAAVGEGTAAGHDAAEGCAVCSTGWAIAGSIVAVVDAQWHECSPGASGLVVVGGPLLSPSVDRDCVLCTLRTPAAPAVQRLWPTGDVGVWTEARGLTVFGRADRVRKYGGQRVALDDVERAMRVPSVKCVAVVTLPATPGACSGHCPTDEQLGAIVVPAAPLASQTAHGAVDPEDGADGAERAVLDEAVRNARRLLPPLAVPRVLLAARSLPLLPSTKVDYATVRLHLLERVRQQPSAAADAVADGAMRSHACAARRAFARDSASRDEAGTHGRADAHKEAMRLLEEAVGQVWRRCVRGRTAHARAHAT